MPRRGYSVEAATDKQRGVCNQHADDRAAEYERHWGDDAADRGDRQRQSARSARVAASSSRTPAAEQGVQASAGAATVPSNTA